MTEDTDDCLLAQQKSYDILDDILCESEIHEEFGRLKDAVYLDHAGATLYSKSQMEACMEDLQNNLYSNPHSRNPSSSITTDAIDNVRQRILRHFNTTEEEYSVIFTSGATAAIKLVAECFSYNNGHFIYCEENHTSIIGMREYLIRSQQSDKVFCVSKPALDLLLDKPKVPSEHSESHSPSLPNALVAFSAQCNFSGAKSPFTSWIPSIKAGSLDQIHLQKEFFVQPDILTNLPNSRNPSNTQKFNWFVILDAASYVASSFLDLSHVKPDFVPISFYKMFGYPTGLGALLVRNESSWVLDKSYFGGGTVNISLPSRPFHAKRHKLYDKFEDGTISFLSILAVKHGLDALTKSPTITKDRSINDHQLSVSLAFQVAKYFYRNLSALRYPNGKSVAKIYCDTSFDSPLTQGPVVTFNLLRMDGSVIGYSEMEQIAYLHNVHLRYGCFCNPGACRRHLGLTPQQVLGHYEAGHVCGDMHDIIDGNPTGAIRASFGYMTSPKDPDFLIELIKKCWVLPCFKDQRNPLQNSETQSDNTESSDNEFRLARIFLYPVKSCGPLEVKSSWPLGPHGLLYDREWLITNSGGVPLTAKREQRLCLIQPHIDLSNDILTLSISGMDDISISLKEGHEGDSVTLGICSSKVCGETVLGYDCGEAMSSWLTKALDKPGLRLIRKCSDFKRQPRNSLDQISLANQSQFLLLSTPTLRKLAQELINKGVSSSLVTHSHNSSSDPSINEVVESLVARFRGNFVVDIQTGNNDNPFAEEQWGDLSIGKNLFESGGPCVRCATICMDPSTGHRSSEPLLTLSEMRSGRPNFGIHLYRIPQPLGSSPHTSQAFLTIGDSLKIETSSDSSLKKKTTKEPHQNDANQNSCDNNNTLHSESKNISKPPSVKSVVRLIDNID